MVEKDPQISVLYSLGYHGPKGIPHLRRFERQLRRHFSKDPEVLNVFWKEDATATPQHLDLIRKLIIEGESITDAFFFAGVLIMKGVDAAGREQFRSGLDYVRREILGEVPPIGLDSKTVIRETGFAVRLDTMLDELVKDGYHFNLELETHTPEEIDELDLMHQTSDNIRERALQLTTYGQTSEAIDNYTHYCLNLAEYLRRRNKPYIEGITRYIEDALESERKLRLALRVGKAHDVIADTLIKTFADMPSVVQRKSYDQGRRFKFPTDQIIYQLEVDLNYYPARSEILRAIAGEAFSCVFRSELSEIENIERVNLLLTFLSDRNLERLLSSLRPNTAENQVREFVRTYR